MFTAMEFLLALIVNLLVAVIIVRFIYYRQKPHKNYVFTLLAFDTIIFIVMSLLNEFELSVGAGFGIFAIFSVLRYRTDPMPAREMTYLFILIGLPVLNSSVLSGVSWDILLIANVATIAILYVLENEWGFHFEQSQKIKYENIALIKPENREALLEDLRERTGLPITRVEIGEIDFLRDATDIKVFYDLPDSEGGGV